MSANKIREQGCLFSMGNRIELMLLKHLQVKKGELFQIGASTTDQKTLNSYILREVHIHSISSKTTVLRTTGNQLINDNNETLTSVNAKEGMTNFISFLNENSHGKSILLVTKNGHVFDYKHLIRIHLSLISRFADKQG